MILFFALRNAAHSLFHTRDIIQETYGKRLFFI